jgi:FkbM family methyltransferase
MAAALRCGQHWLGTYEPEQEQLFASQIKPGVVCYDCGANVGHYTLLFSKLVGPTGKVFAFEPLPANAAFIRKHTELNRCQNVVIDEIALSDNDGHAWLASAHAKSRLDQDGGINVKCGRLDSLALPPPDWMKIDIEGAEIEMLAGAESILRTWHPALAVSLHITVERARECARWLESLGYSVKWSEQNYDLYAIYDGGSN